MQMLKWHKRESYSDHVFQIRVSEQINKSSFSLFIIEKKRSSTNSKCVYVLYSSVIGHLPKIISEFRTISKAKKVAQLLFEETEYAHPEKSPMKTHLSNLSLT